MVAIVDYGVGNLFSLQSSFQAIGAPSVVTSDPEVLLSADRVVLPGVGAFGDAADRLHQYPNLFADWSSSFNIMTEEESMYCIRTYGADKLMFGTDYPVMCPDEDLDYLFGFPLSWEEQDAILWRNAVRIYGLTPPWCAEAGK